MVNRVWGSCQSGFLGIGSLISGWLGAKKDRFRTRRQSAAVGVAFRRGTIRSLPASAGATSWKTAGSPANASEPLLCKQFGVLGRTPARVAAEDAGSRGADSGWCRMRPAVVADTGRPAKSPKKTMGDSDRDGAARAIRVRANRKRQEVLHDISDLRKGPWRNLAAPPRRCSRYYDLNNGTSNLCIVRGTGKKPAQCVRVLMRKVMWHVPSRAAPRQRSRNPSPSRVPRVIHEDSSTRFLAHRAEDAPASGPCASISEKT